MKQLCVVPKLPWSRPARRILKNPRRRISGGGLAGEGSPKSPLTPWSPRPRFYLHSDPTAFCTPQFSPQKNGFSAFRLNSKLQLRKCLNNPRHGKPAAESIMQNVSFASIPEQTSFPPVAVCTVPPNAPHNNLSDNASPKSPSSGMHASPRKTLPDAHAQTPFAFALPPGGQAQFGYSPTNPAALSQLHSFAPVRLIVAGLAPRIVPSALQCVT